MRKTVDIIATFFNIGRLPFAQGTWASIATIFPVYYLLNESTEFMFFLWLVGLFVVGIWVSDVYDREHGTKDASAIVIDEVLGQSIAMLPLLFFPEFNDNFGLIFCSLLLFRFFDIVKPLGIKKIQDLPGGYGVVLDDVLAGIYAALILGVLCKSF